MTSEEPVAGVVLAAGGSSRMDAGFKLLLPFGDGVVVEGPVRAALEAGLEPVVVVTGHRGDEVRAVLEQALGAAFLRTSRGDTADSAGDGTAGGRLRFVHNPRWDEGQGTSLARGIRAVRTDTDASAAAVVLGDEPGLVAGAVRTVVEAWRERGPSGPAASIGGSPPGATPPVLRARYRDRPGHPVVFPREVFAELEALEGDRGAREWLARNTGRVEDVTLDAPAPVDVDTEADYREAAGEEVDGGGAPKPGGDRGDGT